MTTRVQNKYIETGILTVPNVRVRIHVAAWPKVLSPDGQEQHLPILLPREPDLPAEKREAVEASITESLGNRDWRKLRERLINLNLSETRAICEWLACAGYLPQAVLAKPADLFVSPTDVEHLVSKTLGWKPDYVTPAIVASIRKYRDVFAWLMRLDLHKFRRAVEQAIDFDNEQRERNRIVMRASLRRGFPRLKDPAITFMSATKAPSEMDADTLWMCLQGTGTAVAVPAKFWWYSNGKPIVTIETNSPLTAISLSIHIDRNFSQRHWILCAKCGKGRDQIRGRDRFCSPKCRHDFNTTARRNKIKLLVQGSKAWKALPPEKKKRHGRWQWIAAWAKRTSDNKVEVDPSWAKRELSKIKARK